MFHLRATSAGTSELRNVAGPGGAGKTTIALAVAAASAERFPDGVFVLWLAALRSAEHSEMHVDGLTSQLG